jgi:type II secretory pathway component PulC
MNLGKIVLMFAAFSGTQTQAAGPIWEAGGTKCVPNFRKDVQVGYLCTRVEAGSLYAKTGLLSGENITAINGRSLVTSIDAAIDLWQEFERAPNSTLTVERDGKLIELKKPLLDK